MEQTDNHHKKEELYTLIAGISDTFNVEVGIDEIVPENFNSVEAMTAMVEKLQNA